MKNNDKDNIFKKSIKPLTYLLGSAVAVLLILITVFTYINFQTEHLIRLENLSDFPKEIKLPDGNKVWLNKNSVIRYPNRLKGKQCLIEIEGEAYFEIENKKCKVYLISAHNALISVQGSSEFNVRCFLIEENVDITVKKGVVKIEEETDKEGTPLFIKEGHYCTVHKSVNSVFSSENQNDNYLAWKTGKFIFNNTPLITIADLLTDYYGQQVEVESDDIAYCMLTSTFDNKPLEDVLKEIKAQLNLDIKKAGDILIISGKGCYYD